MADETDGPHRSVAKTDPLNVSGAVCWVKEEKADHRTLLQRNQKYLRPIIDKEFEWEVGKWDGRIGGKGETRTRDIVRRKQEAAKKRFPSPSIHG